MNGASAQVLNSELLTPASRLRCYNNVARYCWRNSFRCWTQNKTVVLEGDTLVFVKAPVFQIQEFTEPLAVRVAVDPAQSTVATIDVYRCNGAAIQFP